MTDGFLPSMFSLTKWVLHKIWKVTKLSPWIQVTGSSPASETSLSQSNVSKSSWGDFKWATLATWKTFHEIKNCYRNFRDMLTTWSFTEAQENWSGTHQWRMEKPGLMSCWVLLRSLSSEFCHFWLPYIRVTKWEKTTKHGHPMTFKQLFWEGKL